MVKDIQKYKYCSRAVAVVYDLKRTRAWCARPYVGHPKGCPNFGKRKDCPPGVGLFNNEFEEKVRIAAVAMDFKTYLERRRKKFPQLSDRGLRNPLYWQGHIRLELRNWVKEIIEKGEEVVYTPEAMGVDVTATCKKVGIEIEWPPTNKVYKIAVLAKRKMKDLVGAV